MKYRFSQMKRILLTKKVFLRIVSFYLIGSIFLLTSFSSVLAYILSQRTIKNVQAYARDSVNQAYSMADYILSDAYDSYYQLYQTSDMNNCMFGTTHTIEDELLVQSLLKQMNMYSSCVESVYIVNRTLDVVYTNLGIVSSMENFFDQQSLQLFEFYNENSSTIFLPRTTSFAMLGKEKETHNYITFIFARKDAYMNVQGGLIVNINQNKLHKLITEDIESPQYMYIISQNGSILSSENTLKINTTLQGTKLWKVIEENVNENRMSFPIEYEGQDCLVTYRNANKLMFCFLHIVPMSEVMASVSYIRMYILIILSVAACLAFIVAMIFSRKIYHPISNLVTTLRKQTDSEVISEQDEFSFLGSTYKNMFNKINELNSNNVLLSKAQKRDMLTRLLQGTITSEEQCRKELALCESLTKYPYYTVIVTSLDNYTQLTAMYPVQDLALIRFAIENVATEILSKEYSIHCLDKDARQFIFVLNLPDNKENLKPKLENSLLEISHVLEQYLHFTLTSGIGRITTNLMELSASYNEANISCEYRLVFGCSTVIFYNDIAVRQNINTEYPSEIENNLITAVRNRNSSRAQAEIDSFFSAISLSGIDNINMAVSQLAIALTRTSKSLSASIGVIERMDYRNLNEQLLSCDTLLQRKNLLLQCCQTLITSRNHEVESKKEELMNRICTFIEANYSNPSFSISDIAVYTELSVNYLRAIFKKAVGKSPTDYLIDVRMEHAKELLETSNYSTIEIASLVGYYNHKYFYSVFKTKIGLTPTEYREKGAGKTL